MRSGLRVALAVAGLRGDARNVPSGRNSVAPDERRRQSVGEPPHGRPHGNAVLTPDVALFNRAVNLTPIGSYARQVTSAHAGDSDSWSWGGRLTLRTWGSWRGFAVWSQYLETAMASQVEGTPIVRDRRFCAGLAVLFGGGSLGSSVAQQMVSPQLGLR